MRLHNWCCFLLTNLWFYYVLTNPWYPRKDVTWKKRYFIPFRECFPKFEGYFWWGNKTWSIHAEELDKLRGEMQKKEAGYWSWIWSSTFGSKQTCFFLNAKWIWKKKMVKSTSLHWFHQDIMQILFGGRFGIKNHSKSRELSSWTVLC